MFYVKYTCHQGAKIMKIKDICMMGIMLAILIICSKISFNIGPIPITLQTFAVIILSFILKLKKALIIFGVYIVIGLIGIPVFSGGGGYAYVLKPSFGFIIGFLLSSFVSGIKIKDDSLIFYIIKGLLGLLIIDVVGIVYMIIIMNGYYHYGKSLVYILQIGLLPFILKDILSVFIAALVYLRIKPVLEKDYRF